MERLKPEHLYPAHLYDPLRRQIGSELIEKEFNKQLTAAGAPAIDANAWLQRFDDHTFWNAIEGFMGGTLIKPIVHFLTARNYTWSRQTIPVESIRLSSKLDQLNRLEGLDSSKLYLSDIATLLNHDTAEMSRQRDINDSFSHNAAQNAYLPLIVESDGHPTVMDGNRRCLRALLHGQETIEAWHCETNNENPLDFWFPIDDMLDLVRIYNYGKEQNPQLGTEVAAVLREIFHQSEVAEIAYRERIITHGTKGAKELLDIAGL